jgi:hypothetical protein
MLVETHAISLSQKGEKLVLEMTFELEPTENPFIKIPTNIMQMDHLLRRTV